MKQLIGRQVLIVHGTQRRLAPTPSLSYRLAERAKKVNRQVCRFEVHSDGHTCSDQHRAEVAAHHGLRPRLLLGRSFARPVADALAAPPPLGLRMPLASGFGRSPAPALSPAARRPRDFHGRPPSLRSTNSATRLNLAGSSRAGRRRRDRPGEADAARRNIRARRGI